MIGLSIICFSLLYGYQNPQSDLYSLIPKYSQNPKIAHTTKGPLPNAKIKENDPSSATFLRTEYHPPGLRLLVRAQCGTTISREDLIQMAKAKTKKGQKPLVVDWKDVDGGRVELWMVTASREWKREVKLKAQDGKYVIKDSKVKESLTWYVDKAISPKTYTSCISESEVSRRDVANMVLAGLITLYDKNRRQVLVKRTGS